MKVSLKKLNEHISKVYPDHSIELVKGNGYFYFSGRDGIALDIPSIYVCHFNHLTYAAWVEIVFNSIDDAIIDAAA